MWRACFLTSIVGLFGGLAAAPDPIRPDFDSPRPIDAPDTVFTEEMTWMEIRDAMRAGKTTVIVATGGVEQNGPYLVTGKHQVVLRGLTEAIARKLGNALVAPLIPFVPEGDIDPPSIHMFYPGSISLTEDTYRALLVDILSSMKANGFTDIVLIGDSGGNVEGMKAVSEQLNEKWKGGKTRIHYIPEYYNYGDVVKFLEDQGIKQEDEGYHDDFGMTAMMMAFDPESVRTNERIAANKFRINGIELAPVDKTKAWGQKVIDFRTNVAVDAILKSIGGE
jgi:creatinine amidohydrolase/Fe(II)-dependent formamide hydrolase-like protein